jgi:hypothetical protein
MIAGTAKFRATPLIKTEWLGTGKTGLSAGGIFVKKITKLLFCVAFLRQNSYYTGNITNPSLPRSGLPVMSNLLQQLD